MNTVMSAGLLRILLALLLVLLSACQAGQSTENTDASAAGAAGPPSKIGLCAGCHGIDGRAILPNYPHLAGQNRLYLEKSLRAYRDGERQSAEMRAAVGHLTNDEIADLASYYSAQ